MMLARAVVLVLTASTVALVPGHPAHAEVITTTITVPVTTVVEDPCTAEDVQLSGEFQAVFATSTGDAGEVVVRYAFQSADIKGFGSTTGLRYALVGQTHGTTVGLHRDRLVSATDFEMIARPTAGVEIHRVEVTAMFGFVVGAANEVEQLSNQSLIIDKLDC